MDLISPKNVCLAGIRDYEFPYIEERVKDLGLTRFTDTELYEDSSPLLNWIKSTGKNKVLIHFDMDVLDPTDIISAVAHTTSGGLELLEVVRIINEIAAEFDLLVLTEPNRCQGLPSDLKRCWQTCLFCGRNNKICYCRVARVPLIWSCCLRST